MPKSIHIDEIQDGMILKSPIMNKFGQILLGSGISVKETHKKMLKMWGVEHIVIESDESNNEYIFDDEIYALAKSKLFQAINWEPRNKLEEELIELGIIANALIIQKER
jgi:nucleoside-diphosphate-sugar epimerase